MIKDKLLVILFYAYSAYCISNKYCGICSNHTLCLFPEAGPSVTCVKYDKHSILTQDEIKSILERINSRRNFIASGRSRNLPGAANMKKIVWSDELAIFAQRWVDRCDPSTRPDKEDHCHNLESIEVGQNIATISNLSSNFNIASLIEVWFMQSLDYTGSVTYYNESDSKSRYFTQLVWANTDSVGCGQASFYVKNVTKVLRLVCNFAPKGNIHGKPVYAIGYPATQCQEDMEPDDYFKGLCTYKVQKKDMKLTSQTPPVSSLLRIINLSNKTDLLRKNDTTSKIKSRKLTTIFMNNTHAAVKRYPQHNFWDKSINNSKLRDHNNHQVENPWRVHHGHKTINHFNLMNKKTETESQKYESIYTLPTYNIQNSQKLKPEASCTRKTNPLRNNCDNNNERVVECTRGHKNDCWRETSQYPQVTSPFLYSICSCDSYTTTTERSTAWMNYCQCFKNNPQIICSDFRRTQDDFTTVDTKISDTFYHYDLLPNLDFSGGIGREHVQNKLSTHVPGKESLNLINLYKRKGYIPYNRQRHKRSNNRYTTIVPFWQMDDTVQKITPQFKATARYTTLRNKKLKQTKLKSATTNIEPITLKLITTSLDRELPSITEKYLSFDELMQLRNKGDARRQGDKTKKKAATTTTTTEITTNTPFIPIKHCTRKLTCTWTVAQMTDCNGSVIFDNDGSNLGSRTPPGYVDGCTRTSTCTRDYLDRNKLVPSTDEDSDSYGTTKEIDDDYCERRSLDIHKRNSEEQATDKNNNTDNVVTLRTFKKNTPTSIFSNRVKGKEISNCVCYNLAERAKRDDTRNKNYQLYYKRSLKDNERSHNENLYYGELYYKVLKKIKETWDLNKKRNQLKKCFCKGNFMHDNYSIVLCLILSCLTVLTRQMFNYLYFV